VVVGRFKNPREFGACQFQFSAAVDVPKDDNGTIFLYETEFVLGPQPVIESVAEDFVKFGVEGLVTNVIRTYVGKLYQPKNPAG
jgi:hypothetical protein